MKKLFLISIFLITSLISWSQPSNDNCNTAQNLGTLPTPAACPSGVGSSVTVAGTNLAATYPLPYTTLLGCQTGGNQPGPAMDVWYRFVASGNQANINITPGTAPVLASPAITLWTGTCGGLIGVGCDNNGTVAGNNSATFQPLTPGQTYYIQVSGMNSTSAGNFNISVNASNDCNNCLQVGNLTVSPAPIGGTYLPGTTVNFCYHITSYTQVSSNWLHGLTLTFGSGWNPATVIATPPTSCSGSGYWAWYNSWTSSATSTTWGPGFAYDYNTAPGNPGNNFGDNCSSPNWNFCWSIQTDPTCTGTNNNLNITLNTSGDGESGSWTSVACTGDPNVQFSAVLACCSSTVVGTNPTCFGGNNGSATVTPTGVSPFTYSWSTTPVQTTQTATGLSAGTYTVTVTDNVGCTSTATVTISNPPAMTATMTQSNVTCNGGSNGTATVTPSGSVGPYTYLWSNGQTTQTATGLSIGTYSVTVTSSLGCTVTNSVTITQPTPIIVTTSNVGATCGLSNGSATATVSGGVGPYTYSWNTTPIQTTSTATGLLSGTYTVTVTGVGGCTATATTTVPSTGSITASASGTNVSCFGGANGSATVTPAGTGPFTYNWSNGSTTQSISGLTAGTYSVVVNSAGCNATTTVTITQPTQLVASITTTNVQCNGGTNGSALVTPSGGTGPYTYSWNTTPIQTTTSATGLSSGTYTVTVTDSNGCLTLASANITQPTPLSATISSVVNPSCFGGNNGSISVTTSGGTGPNYLFSINGGPNQISSTFNSLTSGSYTITVTDQNGCTTSVNTVLTSPTPITYTQSITNITCNGLCNGSVSVSPSGGTSPYSFAWSNGSTSNPVSSLCVGTYSVTITDALGCTTSATGLSVTQPSPLVINATSSPSTICIGQSSTISSTTTGGTSPYNYIWTTGSTTLTTTVTPTSTSSYTVQVTDANGCISSVSATVNVFPSISGTATASPATICSGGSSNLSANAVGGNGGPYVYTWSPGGIGQNITVSPTSTQTYTLTISDGCSPNFVTTVTVNVIPNPLVSFTTTPLSGCQPLTVTYNNTTPGVTNCVWNINGNIFNSCNVTETFTTPGTFSSFLTITDANGCTGTSSLVIANVYQIPTASFSISPSIINIMDPTVTFNNTSTAGIYQWNFGDGNTSSSPFPTHTYSDTGEYQVQLIVTTQYGCIDTTYVTLFINDVFSLYIPNSFTPNSDGKNETFSPVVSGYDYYEFWIYNRWGEEIYYSTKTGAPWSGEYKGKLVKDDVYVWKVHAKEEGNAKHHFLVGHVTVLK